MFPQTVSPWLDLVLTVGAIVVMLAGLYRWANRSLEQRIVAEIKEATYQIQPGANGGKSLTDLHKKIDTLCMDVELLKSAVLQLEDEVEGLIDDVDR